MEINWDYFFKVAGPAAFTFAMIYAYRKYLHVPTATSYPIPNRPYIIKGMKIKLVQVPLDQASFSQIQDPKRTYVKVLTYNILADCYTKYFMFKYVKHGYLNFSYRSERILAEIKNSNSDIICLQEVDHYDDFYKPQLEKLGYKTQSAFRRSKDAVVIGYKHDQFELATHQIVDYNDIITEYNDKSMAMHNKAVICLLKNSKSGKKFVVVSSHLHWDPKIDFVKYAQTAYLLKKLAHFRLANKVKDDEPTIVCGDFNSVPDSSCVSLIYNDPNFKRNKYNNEQTDVQYAKIWNMYDKDDEIKHIKGHLRSAYENFNPQQLNDNKLEGFEMRRNGHPAFTNYAGHFKDTLDYIFHSDNMKVVSLLDLPRIEDVTCEEALPNSLIPSDHIRMECLFEVLEYQENKSQSYKL